MFGCHSSRKITNEILTFRKNYGLIYLLTKLGYWNKFKGDFLMKHFLKLVLVTFVITTMPNITKAQNYQNWQYDPMILAELYTCVWQMDDLYNTLDKDDVLPLMNLSKVNITTAGIAIQSAFERNKIPLDVDMYKNVATGKNNMLKQKNALWLDMVNCGVALAKAGF